MGRGPTIDLVPRVCDGPYTLARSLYRCPHWRTVLGTIQGPGPVFQTCKRLLPSYLAHEDWCSKFLLLTLGSGGCPFLDVYVWLWPTVTEGCRIKIQYKVMLQLRILWPCHHMIFWEQIIYNLCFERLYPNLINSFFSRYKCLIIKMYLDKVKSSIWDIGNILLSMISRSQFLKDLLFVCTCCTSSVWWYKSTIY
jgi:hypothetical protein